MTAKKQKIDDATKAAIVEIVRAEVSALMEGQKVQMDQIELPPTVSHEDKVVGEKGRKVAPEKRVKIAGTLDPVLWRKFQEWMKDHGGLTLSAGLDAVFW